MRSILALTVVAFLTACIAPALAQLRVGASRVDASLPIGVPLAGFSQRHNSFWPLPTTGQNYTTWMVPSIGRFQPGWARALMVDNGVARMVWVTLDAIGSDNSLMDLAYGYALQMGALVPRDNVILSASHTHSGPGAINTYFLWQIAPATDLCVSSVRDQLARSIGQAIYEAQQALQPAVMDIGVGQLLNATRNRRCHESHRVNCSTVDTNLGVIRVDTPSGQPIATLWNFAMHGTCLGADNLYLSGDIMGGVNEWLEEQDSVGIALFVNADAGDIDPTPWVCAGAPNFTTSAGAPYIGKAVLATRAALKPSSSVTFKMASQLVDFGPTNLNFTFARWSNCTSGGPLDICGLCKLLRCDVNLHFNDAWIETMPRFTAISFEINGKSTGVVTMPGEALVELGFELRADLQALGFDQALLSGYSNSHLGYFATPDEYDIGGYESQLTFWGVHTSEMVRSNCHAVASEVV